MPGFNGTGPRGMGPMTGGGRGFCNPYGFAYGMGFGYRPGFGRPMGRGRGGGFGRGMRYPYAYGATRPYAPFPYATYPYGAAPYAPYHAPYPYGW
jgi:hypothetical protein